MESQYCTLMNCKGSPILWKNPLIWYENGDPKVPKILGNWGPRSLISYENGDPGSPFSHDTILLSPLRVTAGSNDRVHCTAVCFSEYHTSIQSVSASMIFSKEVAKWNLPHVPSVAGWSWMAEWYTLWEQEFLAYWNLLLMTGPRRLHQKIKKKMIWWLSLIVYDAANCKWSDNPWSVDHWHTCNVECNLRWRQALNNKEQCTSIPGTWMKIE